MNIKDHRFVSKADCWEVYVGNLTPADFMQLHQGISVEEAVMVYLIDCPFIKEDDIQVWLPQALIDYIEENT